MQKIKTFILGNCPHCSKDFYVELEESSIEVKKIYTPVEIVTIKEELKNKLKGIILDQLEARDIYLSIDDENNIFDQEDANNMFNATKEKYEKK